MNQGMQPWEEPLGEGYWEALLEGQSRHSPSEPNHGKWGRFHLLSQKSVRGDLTNPHPGAEVERVWKQQQTSWALMKNYSDTGEVLELEVVGSNGGELIVDCESLRGFVPASQLVGFEHTSEQDRGEQLQGLVGQRLRLRIIELDGDRNRLILSQRAAESGYGSPKEILDQLCPGDICDGWVTNLCPFGAFVDLGGVEGLIHISELSWGWVNSSHEVLSTGDKVEVYVLNVDHERHRVSLSLKRLQPNPWSSVEENYQVGQLVKGIVTKVMDFGAFVRIEEVLEGLIHGSELAEEDFLHPHSVVREGESVTVRIINIDSSNHRLGLSLRQV